MANLQLEIVTPLKILIETEVSNVTLPGTMGAMGILPNHIPIITTLKSGALVYQEGSQTSAVAVHGGYAHVTNDKVIVLAEVAEFAKDIDLSQAQQAGQSANTALKSASAEEAPKIQAELDWAEAQIEAAKMK